MSAPVIDCLCGDRFTTTEDMALHLWMAHGHEVPPVAPQPAPDTLRAAARHVLRWYDETSALGMSEPLSISALRAALEGGAE